MVLGISKPVRRVQSLKPRHEPLKLGPPREFPRPHKVRLVWWHPATPRPVGWLDFAPVGQHPQLQGGFLLRQEAQKECPSRGQGQRLPCVVEITYPDSASKSTHARLCIQAVDTLANSETGRHWHAAQVREIHRIPSRDSGYHWEYVIVSDCLIYGVRNAGRDLPYLNDSLGEQVKIASVGGSDKPYDGVSMFVLDANGQEHQMDLVSVVPAQDGCKK